MDNWDNIWNNISNTRDIDHDNINGFNHCENKINSEKLFKHIINICEINKSDKILEFGCGSGRIGQYFIKNNYDYYGVDKSCNMIKKFIELLNYNNVDVIDSLILPFSDNHFDVILCYSVIQYLNDLKEFETLLNEFIRVSKRIIYIGDLESIDHSTINKKYYKENVDLKHLIVKKEHIKSLNMKYKINLTDTYCSRNSRYNLLVNKNYCIPYNNIYVDMVGDLFHINHINLFKKALNYGNNLIVGVHSDKDVESYKCKPILTMEERIAIIESCKYVNKVIPNAPLIITNDYLENNNIDLVIHAHNIDEEDKYDFMYKEIIKLGKFKRINYHEGLSTTIIKNRIIKEYLANQIDQL